MPRTRSQAVESPLVSLDTPRRRRRATTTARPSVDAPEATAVKSKRGRKPTKKETVLEHPSEEITRNTSIILSEEKENDLQAEEELEVKGTLQAEEQRKPAPQNKNKKAESPSKRKGKKRARDLQDDEGHDEAPSAQRPRLTNSAGRTPYRRRLTTPRRKLPFSEINRRVNEREQGLSSPSMFHLDQIVAQHEADEKAEKARREAAEAAAEVERLESISRAAMERHAVLGPIPENLQNSFEVPVFNDGRQDLNMAEAQIAEAPETPEALELPETPTPNSGWGVGIRNIFSSVTGSVRRFVPNFRHGADEAVPFVAGGDATAMAANDTAVRPVETNGNEGSGTTMDLTYSLFPPTFDVPQTLPESRPVTASAATENGTVHAADKETTQPSGQNLDNGEHKDATDQEPEPKSAGKKRKRDRPPTPDIIPNPPGCSYGLHDDWFVYSDDEIEEAEAYCAAQEAAAAAAASTTEPATPVAERPEKRARFLSPVTEEDSSAAQAQETTREWLPTPPGWARPTTTVYTGTMFKENPGSPRPLRMRAPYPMSRESNQQPAVNPNSHYEPAPKEQAAAVNGTSLHLPQQQDAAVNGTSLHLPQQQDAAVNGTSAHPPHRHPDATNAVPTTPSATVERTSLPPIIQPISASKGQPATDGHRPNNPSRLRNAMRLSSSPMSQPSPTLKLNESNQQDLLQVFGNDEFGRQAYDIYQSCPSGDLGHLQWPGFESIQDQQHIAGNQQNEDFQFKGSFEHFRTEFDRGLLNPDEILSDLPL